MDHSEFKENCSGRVLARWPAGFLETVIFLSCGWGHRVTSKVYQLNDSPDSGQSRYATSSWGRGGSELTDVSSNGPN